MSPKRPAAQTLAVLGVLAALPAAPAVASGGGGSGSGVLTETGPTPKTLATVSTPVTMPAGVVS